jgi:hypothetical protein
MCVRERRGREGGREGGWMGGREGGREGGGGRWREGDKGYATSVSGLKLLVYEAIELLVYEALSY